MHCNHFFGQLGLTRLQHGKGNVPEQSGSDPPVRFFFADVEICGVAEYPFPMMNLTLPSTDPQHNGPFFPTYLYKNLAKWSSKINKEVSLSFYFHATYPSLWLETGVTELVEHNGPITIRSKDSGVSV